MDIRSERHFKRTRLLLQVASSIGTCFSVQGAQMLKQSIYSAPCKQSTLISKETWIQYWRPGNNNEMQIMLSPVSVNNNLFHKWQIVHLALILAVFAFHREIWVWGPLVVFPKPTRDHFHSYNSWLDAPGNTSWRLFKHHAVKNMGQWRKTSRI
jgi:hypothetical protein